MAKIEGIPKAIMPEIEPEWECPIHGRLKEWHTLAFCMPRQGNWNERVYCWLCIEDAVLAAGVVEVLPVQVGAGG